MSEDGGPREPVDRGSLAVGSLPSLLVGELFWSFSRQKLHCEGDR